MSSSLRRDELPEDVAAVADAVAEYLGVGFGDLFIADEHHENLGRGAYSIAFEGAHDWPWEFTNAASERRVSVPASRFLEAGTGWFLGVYPIGPPPGCDGEDCARRSCELHYMNAPLRLAPPQDRRQSARHPFLDHLRRADG